MQCFIVPKKSTVPLSCPYWAGKLNRQQVLGRFRCGSDRGDHNFIFSSLYTVHHKKSSEHKKKDTREYFVFIGTTFTALSYNLR